MHVGALVHMYPPMHNAGAEHMLHAILSEIVNRGHKASVAVSGPRANFKAFTLDGVRVGGLGLLDECDVVLTHLDRTADAERYCRDTGKPCVQLFHNHARPGMVQLCDLAVYNSEWLARDFPVGAPSVIVPPPIWPDRYLVEPAGECITLINLTEAKGARLFYALAQARPDLKFLGVRGAYGHQVEPPTLSNLEVIDTCTDVRDVYARTRVLLMPSSYESYGRVAVEASVSGIPVIATGTPGLREALGEAGVFPYEAGKLALGGEVPLSTLPAWSAALVNVLADWDTYSDRAKRRVERLDPHADIDRLIHALRGLVQMQPDVVYVCREGEKNEELRYSLRSLVNLPHRHVWIFGGCPQFARNVKHVPVSQGRRDVYLNTTRLLEAACRHPDVSDPFILMNDDFFVVEPIDSVPLLNRGPVSDVVTDCRALHGRRSYVEGMERVVAFLEARGYPDPLSFELHAPMLVDKATMLEAIAMCPDDGMHKRTVYGALAGLVGETVPDCKIHAAGPLPPGPFISSRPSVFRDSPLPHLKELFPRSGRYEEGGATMKVRARRLFNDRVAGRRRQVGEEFDVTDARFHELNSTRFGQLVAPVGPPIEPDLAPAPETVKDIKAILNARGIQYRKSAKKEELRALL